MEENLLRVGSSEYEASPTIKKHSLDLRVNRRLKPALKSLEDALETSYHIKLNGEPDDLIEEFLKD